MSKPMLMMSALAVALLAGSGVASAAEQPSLGSPRKQQTETVYGSQLMSAQERSEHRERMCAAASVEEQEQIRREHHEKMRERAEARGLTLPETPPRRGPWMGSCGSMRGPRPMAAYSTAGEAATIPYESTGIGADEREGVSLANYNLHLVFATQGSGAYLADIRVAIEDARKNRILEADSPGPIFNAKLPPGTYRITANYQGKPMTKTVAVKDHGRSNAYFYWRSEETDIAGKSGR